jgi:hypothetical protein
MGSQNLAAHQGFLLARISRLAWKPTSGADFQHFVLDQIVELILLPFPAAHLCQGMGGLKLPFAGLRQSIAQAAATQLRRPAMEAMEVSGPCHEHLLVVTPQV